MTITNGKRLNAEPTTYQKFPNGLFA